MAKTETTSLGYLEPVEHQTVQAQIHRKLRQALMRGDFVPGQVLTLRGLAEAMGTSAMPVREALRQLQAEQAIDILPNRTITVPKLSRERLEELRRIRIAIESMVAEEAGRHVSPADVRHFETLHREMVRCIERNDSKGYLALNQDFHFTLYRASMMPTAVGMIESLWLQFGPAANLLLTTLHLREDQSISQGKTLLVSAHEAALEALVARDHRAVGRAIKRDIFGGMGLLLNHWAFVERRYHGRSRHVEGEASQGGEAAPRSPPR